jgi:hypothetical protein
MRRPVGLSRTEDQDNFTVLIRAKQRCVRLPNNCGKSAFLSYFRVLPALSYHRLTAFLPMKKRINERVKGIEPSCAAWEAAVLPLNYTREEIFDFRFAIADCNRNKFAG